MPVSRAKIGAIGLAFTLAALALSATATGTAPVKTDAVTAARALAQGD
jgi:hypothetical protein